MQEDSDSSRVVSATPRPLISAHPLHTARAYSAILDRDDQPVRQPTREQGSCNLGSPRGLHTSCDGRTYRRKGHRKEKKSGAEMNAIRNGHTANVVPRSKWTRLCEAAENRLIAARIHVISTTTAIPVGKRPSRVPGRPKRATQRTASTPKLAQYSSRTQNANPDTS
jgi:hypothetical protein